MIKALRSIFNLAIRDDAVASELAPSLPVAEAELAAAREAQAAAEAAYRAQLLTADEAALRRLVEARTDAGCASTGRRLWLTHSASGSPQRGTARPRPTA